MNIHITLVAYALDIVPLVKSLNGDDVTWHIYLHSQRQTAALACDQIAHELPNADMYPYFVNRGLARSWNDGLIKSAEVGADVMMIANDDIVASRDDLLKIAQAAVEHRDYGVIEGVGFDKQMQRRQSMAWALCAVNPIAIEKVGYFDESYMPIYGEDVDYARRCRFTAVRFFNVGETGIVHTGGATVKGDSNLFSQNQVTFPRNEEYHRAKHGGGYGREVFTSPFNDPSLTWKIPADSRHDPYPGYNRTDQDIIKV